MKFIKHLKKNTTLSIGFSKFCQLRPKNCILAGKSGTHSVCVCNVHQNVKLMIDGSGLKNFTLEEDELPCKTYHSFLAKMMCNPPAPQCYMNECTECPGTAQLKESLFKTFENELIDEVTYQQWMTVDRCTMEMVVKNTDDFIEDLMGRLLKLKTHSFIANIQKDCYVECKAKLAEGEVLVNCDFAENYSFVLQDEVQSYHWTSSQATLHPFIVYYKWQGKLRSAVCVYFKLSRT